MEIQQEQIENQNIQLINTVSGTKNISEFADIQLILPHEHIVQNLSKLLSPNPNENEQSFQNQITLNNLYSIRNNPFCNLSNLALIDYEEMAHELTQFQKKILIIIIDTTAKQDGRDIEKLQKISQISNVPIICGYSIYVDEKYLSKEEYEKNKKLLTKEYFIKELDLEVNLGTLNCKPGFLGPILFSRQFPKNEIEDLQLQSYLEVSLQKNIPIFCDNTDCIDNKNLQNFINNLTQSKKIGLVKLVFINPKLEWKVDYLVNNQQQQQKFEISEKLINFDEILQLLKCFTLCFDLITNEQTEINNTLQLITYLCKIGYSENIIVSNGIRFKTHLTKYGGVGFDKFLSDINLLNKLVNNQDQVNNLLKNNILKLLTWPVAEKPKIISIKMWTCPECQKEFEETIEKFKKFNKEFCSIKCLRENLKKNT